MLLISSDHFGKSEKDPIVRLGYQGLQTCLRNG